jgi:PadR family transcriptional regulator, regulatory protein AphA
VSIKFVILGFLSEASLTGYDLKKKFSASEVLHWSGNNNQIYRTLVDLHQDELVTIKVEHQDNKPPRKIYTITDKGIEALRQWMRSTPDLPQFRNPLLAQLTWAGELEPREIAEMLARYKENLEEHITMLHEVARRNKPTQQNRLLGERVVQHWIAIYELELQWVQTLQQELY